MTRLVGEDLMQFHQSMVVGPTNQAEDEWTTSIPQDLPMSLNMKDIPESRIITPEPHINSLPGDNWEEHQHLMHPMFMQSPDEIDLPPLDPELLDHHRRRQDDEAVEASDA